jgi:adenylate kinase family enzyme
MKKICLMGSHGTGKTTTAYGIGYRLKQMRYDTDILYETARKCPLPINKKGTIDSQKWILAKQLEQESLIDPTIDFAICDRSLIDIYVYSLNTNRKFAKSILPFVIEHMKTFDYIFYLPIRDAYFKGDSKRSACKQYQINIDRGMRNAIDVMVCRGIYNIVEMINNDKVADSIVTYILTKGDL